jgi:hypothetical protein
MKLLRMIECGDKELDIADNYLLFVFNDKKYVNYIDWHRRLKAHLNDDTIERQSITNDEFYL